MIEMYEWLYSEADHYARVACLHLLDDCGPAGCIDRVKMADRCADRFEMFSERAALIRDALMRPAPVVVFR